MSAVTTARPRLSRRSLERQGMTPEQELELLIAEQQADDTHRVRKPVGEISYDGPAPGLEGNVEDFIGVDDEGVFYSFLPREEGTMFTAISITHATFDAYNNHRCRCRKCKTFMADYRRGRRAGS